jgi:peptidoglycan/LPS O-acetylase OafA/YrhL
VLSRENIRAVGNFQMLTALRGVFAWWVTLYHVRHWLVGTPAQGLESLLSVGYLGVDFFFVLSGFVIHHRYAQYFVDNQADGYRRFIKLRIARIYPLHLFMSVVYLVNPLALILLSSTNDPDLSRYSPGYFLLSLLLVQNWGWTDELKWNAPSWSISTEFFAYLVYPYVSIVLARRSARAILLLFGIGAIVLLLPLLAQAWGVSSLGEEVPRFGLVRCLSEFLLGNLVAALFARQTVVFERWSLALLFSAIAVSVLVMFAGPPDYAFVPLLVCLLIAGVAGLERKKPLEVPKALVHIGEISYATYLCHYFVKDWFGFLDLPERLGGMEAMIAYCMVVVILSDLLYRFVEIPGQNGIKRRFISGAHSTKIN